MDTIMIFPHCQYSNVTWIRKDSAAFKTLSEGLTAGQKTPDKVGDAVATFLATLSSAHDTFKNRLRPGANMHTLLQAYQDTTGIISTRDYTLPDIPSGPDNDPSNSFATDLIEGIAGAAMTEIGIGITLYTLVIDLIAMFDIPFHVQGLLFNTGSTDLEDIQIRFGEYSQPNMLPLSSTIPAAKPIMNPLDKKNYDCIGFTVFGAVGELTFRGINFVVSANRKNQEQIRVYAEFHMTNAAVAQGYDERNHAPLSNGFVKTPEFTGVVANHPAGARGIAAIVCG